MKAGKQIYCRAGMSNWGGDVGLSPPSSSAGWNASGSDGDSLQPEHLGLVPEQLGAELNNPPGYRVEVLDLLGLESLEKLPQALDEPALLLAAVVVGVAKLQEDLVI